MLNALIAAVVLSGPQPAPPQGFARQWLKISPQVTGKNGYEDYIAAAVSLDTDAHRAFTTWELYHEQRSNELQYGAEPDPERKIPPAPAGLTERSTRLDVRRAYARQFGNVVEVIKAGNSKPVFDPRTAMDAATIFPEYAQFKQIVRSFGKIAYAQLADGNSAAASTTLLEGLKFARNISRVGPIIANLVGVAMQAIILAEFEKSLDRFSSRDLVRILTVTRELLSEKEPALAALEVERKSYAENEKLFTESWDEFIGDEDPLYERLKAMTVSDRKRVFQIAQARVSKYLRSMEDVVRAGDSKWLEFRDTTVSGRGEQPKNLSSLEEIADAFADQSTPVFSQFLQAAAKAKTQLRLLSLHAQILKYRWEHDRLPNKLSDAVPESQIADPFSKESFVFEREGHYGYRLYSNGFEKTGLIELRYRRPISVEPGDEDGPRPPGQASARP